MRILLSIIIIIFVFFVVSFSLQNASDVHLKYYDFIDVILPIYALMFVAFLAGIIFTALMGLAERLKLAKTMRELNKTVRDLRRELRPRDVLPDADNKIEDLSTDQLC
ncbi:MAG: LapA family protein [Syntrophales bacterium]